MKYYVKNGFKTIECTPDEVSFVLVNSYKKNVKKYDTYTNLNFFAGNYREAGEVFTLPVGHIVCDYDSTSTMERHYCGNIGTFNGNKFRFDSYDYNYHNQFYHKNVDVFAINNGVPVIERITHIKPSYSYCTSGILIMRNGTASNYKKDALGCGWLGSELYGTCHIFVGLKRGSNTIYLMDGNTTSGNMISSLEAYKKFKAMGFTDVMKFDGGGSTIMKYKGSIKHAHKENRQISAIFVVKDKSNGTSQSTSTSNNSKTNPYTVAKVTLRRGSKYPTYVKWLQWELNNRGYSCSIDGSFGPGTETALIKYQTDNNLEPDGICGPATRASLVNKI